jgi:hypothetical protein
MCPLQLNLRERQRSTIRDASFLAAPKVLSNEYGEFDFVFRVLGHSGTRFGCLVPDHGVW